jgi:flagellar biosynthesis protein FlhG
VLVTTPDPAATMDTYATIKGLLSDVVRAELEAVVNRVHDEKRAAAAYERIDASCRRFLGRQVGLSGYVADDELVAAGGETGVPVVLRTPQSSAALDLARLATNLAAAGHDAPAASSNPENAA